MQSRARRCGTGAEDLLLPGAPIRHAGSMAAVAPAAGRVAGRTPDVMRRIRSAALWLSQGLSEVICSSVGICSPAARSPRRDRWRSETPPCANRSPRIGLQRRRAATRRPQGAPAGGAYVYTGRPRRITVMEIKVANIFESAKNAADTPPSRPEKRRPESLRPPLSCTACPVYFCRK